MTGFILSGFLTGCASTPHPEGMPLPAMTFENLAPIPVNVKIVNVKAALERHPSPGFVVSPYDAARTYLQRRFVAQGMHDSLNAYIDEASVKEAGRKADSRVLSFMNVGGHMVYTVRIKIRLEHVAENKQVLYSRSVTVTRVMTITEHSSIAARETREFDGMEALFADIDKAVTAIVDEMGI